MSQNVNDLKLRIVALLVQHEKHVRAIADQLQESVATVARLLISLEEQHIVMATQVGKNKVYTLKKNIQAKQYVFMMEQYKFIIILKKYPLLQPLFEDVVRAYPNILIVLFGSYAKGNAKSESDIDMYVGTTDLNIKKKIESMNSKLSVKIGSFDLQSPLIKEIIKNHVIVSRVEIFYDQYPIFK